MVQGVNKFPPMPPMCGGPMIPHCHCGDIDKYIHNLFIYFETEASFKAHLEKGFISPSSIVFLEETGQIYVNEHFFGVCKEDFEQLKSVVLSHTRMIQNILGIDGPSVGDGVLNNLKDIAEFLSGYTTEEGTLRDIILALEVKMTESIELVKGDLQAKYVELITKINALNTDLENAQTTLNSRIDANYSDILLLKQRMSVAETRLNDYQEAWKQFQAEYEKFSAYMKNLFENQNNMFRSLQDAQTNLHEEMERLNSKVNTYDSKIEKCLGLIADCNVRIDNMEKNFTALSAEVHEFFDTKGHPNGLAPLDGDGKIAAQFLPSYVDDVLEFPTIEQFPDEGEFNKIYVTLDTNLTYRWTGSRYIEISKSIGLGETPESAYPGDKGKSTADALARHKGDYTNPHKVTKAQVGLSEVDNTADMYKPVSGPQQDAMDQLRDNVTKDITTKFVAADEELKKELSSNITDTTQKLDRHIADLNNPHRVTKSQLGLGMVDNTADMDKPVSVPQKVAIDDAKRAGTDAQADITAHKNDTSNPHSVTAEQVGLGRVNNTSDTEKPVSQAQRIAINAVQTSLDNHKADKANPHEVTKEQVGLGRVDNTSDLEKPISTATLNALKTQRDEIMEEFRDMVNQSGEIDKINKKLEEVDTKFGEYEKTTEVDRKIAAVKSEILGGAGQDYDTLKELQTWIEEHQDLYTALVSTVGEKAKASEVYKKSETYTKAEVDAAVKATDDKLANYYTKSETYTKAEVDKAIEDAVEAALQKVLTMTTWKQA